MRRIIKILLVLCIFLFLANGVVESQGSEENNYLEVYNYRTGELISIVKGTSSANLYSQLENKPMSLWVPDFMFVWEEDKQLGVLTDSMISKIGVDIQGRRLYVWLEKGSVEGGKFTLFVSPGIASPSDVKVYLDNEPTNYIVVENLVYRLFAFLIHVDLRHRSLLLFDFGSSLSRPSLGSSRPSQGINVILLAGGMAAVVVIIGMTIWLRFRK
jgi:hypothetical protein